MKRLLGLLTLGMIWMVSGCGSETNSSAAKQFETKEKEPAEEMSAPSQAPELVTESYAPKQYHRYRPELVVELELLDSLYNQAPFYVEVDDRRLYYVNNGVQTYNRELKFNKVNGKYGIVDSEGQELLPAEYTKLYQPDGTTPGYIEVEKKGKRGLWNYATGGLIPCTYDVIYPFVEGNYVAIGQQDEDFFYISPSGSSKVTEPEDFPTYANIFSTRDPAFFPITDSIPIHLSYQEFTADQTEYELGSVVLPPSWKLILATWPEYIYLGPANSDYGDFPYYSKHYIAEAQQINENFSSVFAAFYEEGIGVRDDPFEFTSYELVLMRPDNQVVDRIEINAYEYHDFRGFSDPPCECTSPRPLYSFKTPQLLEVQGTAEQSYHETMGWFEYYQLDRSGSPKKLNSKRSFPSTEFVKMDSSYFKVCWLDPSPNLENDYTWIYYLAGSHLTIRDLDIMRNEIFASYGYRFKGKEWQDYFGKKKWYQPRFDNVDDQLTEIDRHNIDLLLKTKADMQAHPENYPQPRTKLESAAG